MVEVQSLLSVLWWFPYITMFFAAGCIAAGLWHAYSCLRIWRSRGTPVSDPIVAEVLEGVKPPPYAFYSAFWCVAGIVLTGLTIMLWH